MQGKESKTALCPEGLRVFRSGKSAKSRSWVQIQGLAPPTKLGVYDATVANGERAFAERYFLCEVAPGRFEPALQPKRGAFESPEMMSFANAALRTMQPVSPATHREVVGAYVGSKLRRYQEALQRLEAFGLSARHARLVAFIKFEKQALDKAPRVINPRSAEYNIELGRFLKMQEEAVFHAIDQVWGGKTVIKGVNPEEAASLLRSKWETFKDPVAVGLDAKKFDMHVSKEALRYEHCWYLAAYMRCSIEKAMAFYDQNGNMGCSGTVERLRWLLKQQLRNVGQARFQDGRLRFAMEGTRSSGDLNTSLGNCVLMCAMIHSLTVRLGVRAALANNGDDCVLFLERGDVDTVLGCVPEHFTGLGFRMEVEPVVDVFERVEFCQSRPIQVEGVWRMVRHPLTTIQKASMCLTAVANEKALRKWLMAVGLCEGVLGEGVPVLQAWAACYRRHGLRVSTRHQVRVMRDSFRLKSVIGRAVQQREIHWTTRVSYYRAFGVTPEEQVALETNYQEASLSCVPGGLLTASEALRKPTFAFESCTVMLAGRI